jgi:hypothetical protein
MRTGEGFRQRWGLLLLVVAMLGAPSAGHTQAGVSPEEVKAAFLFRFAGFVEWPPQSGTEERFVFGIVDAPEVEAQLRRYASLRPIGQQHAEVRHVVSASDLAGIHVFFIGGRDAARLTRWIAAARERPILVVTDAADGLERGSVLNFVTTDRVQFEASVEAASRAGLRLNPRLLSVATRVKKGEASGRTLLAGSPGGCCVTALPARREATAMPRYRRA